MRPQEFVWLDFRREQSCLSASFAALAPFPVTGAVATEALALYRFSGLRCRGLYCHDAESADPLQLLIDHRPRFVCIEFDHPDTEKLRMIRLIKARLPRMHILMLTEEHSEPLAVWAFRSGVWDYVVKPVAPAQLLSKFNAMMSTSAARVVGRGDWPAAPPSPFRAAGKLGRGLSRTADAVAFVEKNFDHQISLGRVAALCHVSESRFCRLFKEEHGMSFTKFLARYRIEKAIDNMVSGGVSISAAAVASGFTDLSYFDRTFKRVVGLSPSQYRNSGPH